MSLSKLGGVRCTGAAHIARLSRNQIGRPTLMLGAPLVCPSGGIERYSSKRAFFYLNCHICFVGYEPVEVQVRRVRRAGVPSS
jgi:hypothetical protein